jgi:hypothetical protein
MNVSLSMAMQYVPSRFRQCGKELSLGQGDGIECKKMLLLSSVHFLLRRAYRMIDFKTYSNEFVSNATASNEDLSHLSRRLQAPCHTMPLFAKD